MIITPRPHQLDFAAFHRSHNHLGSFMYHKMGSGKTITGLWEARYHLACMKNTAPAAKFLVLCPKSAQLTWKNECAKNTPDLLKHMICLPFSQLKKAALRVKYSDVRFIIIDESHNLKSMETDRMVDLVAMLISLRDSIGGFRGGRLLCLTGTPMPNHAGEVYSTWALCGAKDLSTAIQLLSNQTRFKQWRGTFANSETKVIPARKNKLTGTRMRGGVAESWKGIQNVDMFMDLMRPITHYVEDIGTKEPTIVPVDLGLADDKLLEDADMSKPDMYMKLNHDLSVAKIPYMFDWVEQFLKNMPDQLLIFSMYTDPLRRLQNKFPGMIALITGDESDAERKRNVQAFQSGQLRVIAMSYKCGSESLNLQNAKYSLYHGYPWTDATVKQAMARTNRQGQQAETTFHYFLFSGINDHKNLQRVLAKEEATNILEAGLREGKKKHQNKTMF